MTEYMHLVGAEQVQSAASTMRSAADEMQRAASTIASALDAHQQFMTNWLQELRDVLPTPRGIGLGGG